MAERTDRELLELAAKAAGRQIKWSGNVAVLLDFEPEHDDCSAWCPLTDDGDALRLAVRLGLSVNFSQAERRLSVFTCDHAASVAPIIHARYGKDQGSATRLAIVTAAAEIGAKP